MERSLFGRTSSRRFSHTGYYFPQILDHFIDAYPSLRINLVEEKTVVLAERLKARSLDCAFLAEPIYEDALELVDDLSREYGR